MRLVGTTRTAVAVALFAAAAFSSTESVARSSRRAAPTQKHDGEGLFIAWGGDVTLGSSYGNPPDAGRPLLAAVAPRCARPTSRRSTTRAPSARAARPSAGPGQRELLRLPGARGQRQGRCAGPAWTWSTTPTTTPSTTARSGWRASRDALKRAKVGATGAPGEIVTVTKKGTKVAFAGFSTYPWSNQMGDEAARARADPARRRAGRRRRRLLPRRRRGRGQDARARAARRRPSASTAATAAASRASRSTPAPTSCSAPARTSCAASSSTRTA